MMIRLLQIAFAVLIPLTALAALPPAPLPQTGQDTCYDSAGTITACSRTGQDGDILAGQPWPNPRFEDNADQTINDNLTGLQWTQDANIAGGTTPGGYKNWQQALDYIKTLNSQNYLGHNDWRLPNRNELASLINQSQSSQATWLNTQGFTNVKSQYYWTSSSGTNYNNYAWNVYMETGYMYIQNKIYSLYVWPVRTAQLGSSTLPKTGQTACFDVSGNAITCTGTGQDGELQVGVAWLEQRFVNNGDQSITDGLTGLVWAKDGNAPGPATCGPGTSKNWQDALNYIKCLNANSYLGKGDWRMPNVNELASLINLGQLYSTPWLITQGFSNVKNYYWSSSTPVYSLVSASSMILGSGVAGVSEKTVNGFLSSASKTSSNNVWPVRGGHWNALIFSSDSISFTNTLIGSTPIPQTFTITNDNFSGSIHVNDITIIGADATQFAVAPGGVTACSSLTPTIVAGDSCTVQSIFVPTSAGAKAANLQISYTGAYSSKTTTVQLSGQGITSTPIVTGFTIPVTATNPMVLIYSLTATDDTAVTGYCVTETNNPASCVWNTPKPASYTFSSIPQTIATTKILYAFAKDAAGNISSGVSATVVVTLPDTTAPTISIFTLPSSSTTTLIPITAFTTTDNVGVTSYCVSETNSSGACTWSANAPTQYTFAFAVPAGKILYSFAKDAAGNISNSAIATTTITLPDVTNPTVSSFSIPATSSSLAVAISTFTATDNTAVTGYCLSETDSSSGCIWNAIALTNHTFNAAGSKSLYAFAKDAAGNVSTSATAAVTIILPDTTAPSITAFTIPATSNSLTVAILAFTTTDNIAVTGYLLCETGNQPQSNDQSWSANLPTQYVFTSQGSKTLYTFARDAAGNVSVPLSAVVTITLADTTAPTVTLIILPTTATSLTVPITALVATDAVGVTSYLISESATQPQSNDQGWSATLPIQHVFTSQGVKTLYAFAKDAAGNISAPLSATVTITLADTTAPVVTNFTIPVNSASLTVPVTTLVATDSVDVTGYLASETATQPQSNDPNWLTTLPTQYIFTSQGAKTLYAFAKDAAGNISAPLAANVTITLADITAPAVTAFTIPVTTNNLIVSVSSFTATDAIEVTGYYLGETSAVPLLSDTRWATTPTSSFTFASAGAKTLYAFAKDAAGNISAPVSGTVTVTLADTTAPIVTVFTMPTTATSLTVPVTTFTSNDNTAVIGYILTESATPPLANAIGWTSTAPSSYTFSAAGSLTLYAFAKDAAGNISAPVAASIAITLPDTTAPTVTTFVIPATSSSLTVPVTTFTATDNVAVTGYLLSEGLTVPSLTTQSWTSTSPGSYTFSTAGSKTLYAFAKDAAGNISPPASGSVVISLSPPAPINGVCGSSNGQAQGAAPTINLCSLGAASAITGIGPWNWTCSGTNGGTTASCSASIVTLPPTQFTVTPTTGSGFTITPATPQTVNNNATTSFTVSSASGYGIATVSGCGGSLSGSSYTTGTITAGCTVIVTSVARTASSGGTSQPNVSDALKALQAVVGITPLNATEQIRYDVAPLSANGIPLGNGTIDAADVVAILRRSIGIGSW